MNTNIQDLEFTLGDGEDMSFFRITDAKASFHFRPLHCQGNELNMSNLRVGMLQIKYQQPHYNQAQMVNQIMH